MLTPTINKVLFCIACIFIISSKVWAQLPTCTGASAGYIYYLSGNNIYNLNPTAALSASNPVLNTIVAPTNAAGLSLGPNLNAASPSPTFYTTVSGIYYYYNGSIWVNTGYTVGNTSAVNPGGGGAYIYNLVGSTGQIYTYNGAGNGTLLTTLSNFNGDGPFDLSTDCGGNFYALQDNGNTPGLFKYSPTGSLIGSYTVANATSNMAGGGFGIVNNVVYSDVSDTLYGGPIIGGNVTFTRIGLLSPSASDFSTCPIGGIPAFTDTVYTCSGGAGVSITDNNTGPFVFTVLSGPATVTGGTTSGTAMVTAPASSVIICRSTASACGGGPVTDTFRVIVPTAVVSSGLPATIAGCGTYTDTLSGYYTDTTAGVTYTYRWTPAATITYGDSTRHPIIHPVANTTYSFIVSSIASQGGCSFTDSGLVTVVDKSVVAKYTDTAHYGCAQDTVIFANQSTGQTSQYWDFGDNNGSPLLNPTHIYTSQGVHSVLLTARNALCVDSSRKTVDPPHPIHALFTVSADTICQNISVNFTNTSVGTTPTYLWRFGDGSTDTTLSPAHLFAHPGTYLVLLAEKDFVPCYDTVKKYVTVDSASPVSFTTSDSVLCRGKAVVFTGNYGPSGYLGNVWDFGDGSQLNNVNPVEHGYLLAGTYHISITANYRACPNLSYFKDVTVRDYPMLNLGADTAMCPNASPILIGDMINEGNPNAAWLWNTGDTTATINAALPGVYYATVSVNGCATSDSVWIKNDCYLSIPNVFTPNNDGTNDYFFPRQQLSSGVVTFKMEIYNRWGQLIFETTNVSGRGWDGKLNGHDQPEGVYIYTIAATYTNGTAENYKGNITLLR